jgi:cbb3-type cytochrome oxidase subunit 3
MLFRVFVSASLFLIIFFAFGTTYFFSTAKKSKQENESNLSIRWGPSLRCREG